MKQSVINYINISIISVYMYKRKYIFPNVCVCACVRVCARVCVMLKSVVIQLIKDSNS